MKNSWNLKKTIFALTTVPLMALSLVACSPGQGSTDSTADSGSQSESQIKNQALEWDRANAKCIRDAGFDMPDPNADGTGQAMALDPEVDFTALSAAMDACTKKLGTRPATEADKTAMEQYEKDARDSAKCLRENGYDAPDPVPGGPAVSGPGTTADIPADIIEKCSLVVSGSRS